MHGAGAVALLTQPVAKAGAPCLQVQFRPQVPATPLEDIWSGAEQDTEEVVVPPAESHSCQQFWDAGGRVPRQRSRLLAYSYAAWGLKS